jgi:hypothetical protein
VLLGLVLSPRHGRRLWSLTTISGPGAWMAQAMNHAAVIWPIELLDPPCGADLVIANGLPAANIVWLRRALRAGRV